MQVRQGIASVLSEEMARLIDDALVLKWNDDSKEYNKQVRQLLLNLRDPNNPDLKTRIMSGELTPEKLSVATADVSLSTLSLHVDVLFLSPFCTYTYTYTHRTLPASR